MRYQSRTPLRSRLLNLPAGLSTMQQRANPTCSLSLANVSVGCNSGGAISTMDMELDITPTVLVAVPQPDKITSATVPFPKRPHSLLRGTTESLETIGNGRELAGNKGASEQEQGEEAISSCQDSGAPPRKRTRTIALSTTRRARRLTSPIAAIQRVYTPPILTALVPSSAVESEASSSVDIASAPFPCSETSALSAVTQRPFWYRRRYNSTDMKVILYLYRTLVYGLEVRYAGSGGAFVPPSDSQVGITARSYLDVQDACLAQHLKDYLLRHGTNPLQLVVDLDAISQEGQNPSKCTKLQVDFDPMDVDTIDSSHSSNSKPCVTPPSYPGITPFLHPHIHASTTHSILSYQQLIPAIHMRRQLQRSNVNRSQQNFSSGHSTFTFKPRKSSPLVETITFDRW